MIPREQVKQALFGIHSVGANVIGVALNRVDLHTNGYFDYHSDYLPDGKGSPKSFTGGGFSGYSTKAEVSGESTVRSLVLRIAEAGLIIAIWIAVLAFWRNFTSLFFL